MIELKNMKIMEYSISGLNQESMSSWLVSGRDLNIAQQLSSIITSSCAISATHFVLITDSNYTNKDYYVLLQVCTTFHVCFTRQNVTYTGGRYITALYL